MSEISPPKIVIRTPNWLGDHVMASGFVKAVLDYYHESEVDLIVKSGFENLPLPRRGKVIVFDPEKNLCRSFRKKFSFRKLFSLLRSPSKLSFCLDGLSK